MPYPNEHAVRLEDPNKYTDFRRTNGGKIYGSINVPKNISIIWGHIKGTPLAHQVPQALRFPKIDWTVEQAKKWLKDNNVTKIISFDPAITTK